jgi:putative addiction module component (TIGR02574 family)
MLIRTLDKDAEEPLTLKELDRRSEELRSGRVKAVPAEEMIARSRRRLRA